MNAPTRVALIDMGTNTFHLLIAELYTSAVKPPFKILFKEKVGVKIGGEGGINSGIISDAAIVRALNTLSFFRQKIDEFGVADNYTKAMATSAVRNASNGSELVEQIAKQTRIRVETISGDQEATLIYKGVRLAMRLGEQPHLIMDIGGGSVEFIIGNDNQIFWKQSFELGGQRLCDLFMHSDPIATQALVDLKKYLSEQLIPLQEAVNQYKPSILVGVSGTFDTLAEMYLRENSRFESGQDVEATSEHSLPITFVLEKTLQFASKNREERLCMEGMIPLRVDMIVVATSLIDFILHMTNISSLRVSTYSLKEGILSEMLEEK